MSYNQGFEFELIFTHIAERMFVVAPGAVVNHGAERYEIQSSRSEEKPGAPPCSGYVRNILGIIPLGTTRNIKFLVDSSFISGVRQRKSFSSHTPMFPQAGNKVQLSCVGTEQNLGWVLVLCRQDVWENITQLQGRDLTSAGRLLQHSLSLPPFFDKK